MPTDQPSGSSQMLRIDLPSTLITFLCRSFVVPWASLLPGGAQPANRRVCALPIGARGPRRNLPGPKTCRRFAVQSAGRRPVAAIDYEVEYNNRARVPEHPEIFARWTHEAELYRAEMLKDGRAELGLTYGSTPRQIIDLFLAELHEK